MRSQDAAITITYVVVLFVFGGCGRLDFDARPDARGDAIGGDGACAFGAFGSPVNLGAGVNSVAVDIAPALSGDALTLVFLSDRSGASDLYQATRTTTLALFGPATDLGAPNSPQMEFGATLSRDGLSLFFASDRGGSFQLYTAVRATTAAPWSAAVLVGGTIASEEVRGVTLSKDGTELFYNHVTPISELVRATRVVQGFDVVGLVTELNQGADGNPTLSDDGLTIYFETRRPPHPTDSDIYVAVRAAVGAPFGPPNPVGVVANGGLDETDPEISDDGTTLMFTAALPDSLGGPDVYQVTRSCL